MRQIGWGMFVIAGEALAHPDHGMPGVHLHWWEYALLAAVIAAAVVFFASRK